MGKDLSFSKLFLGLAAISQAMEAGINELTIFLLATAGITLLGELFWNCRHVNRWPLVAKISVCALLAVVVYLGSFIEFIRPPIVFQSDNGEPFITTDNSGTKWIRIRAINRGWREVICRIYLTRLEKDTNVIVQERLPLFPNTDEPTGSTNDRVVPPYDDLGQIYNLASIKKGATELSLQSEQFNWQPHPPLGLGAYVFTVRASYSTCRSDAQIFKVKYKGDQDVSFE